MYEGKWLCCLLVYKYELLSSFFPILLHSCIRLRLFVCETVTLSLREILILLGELLVVYQGQSGLFEIEILL